MKVGEKGQEKREGKRGKENSLFTVGSAENPEQIGSGGEGEGDEVAARRRSFDFSESQRNL